MVAQDEIDIDQMIKEFQNSNEKIIQLEESLENLKTQKLSKKDL